MAAQLGIPTYGVRACAKVRDDKKELSRVTLELLLLNLIGTITSYAAITLCILFIPRVRADGMLFAILSLTVVLNAIGMEWLYQGLEQYTYITIRSLIFKTVALAAVFLLVHDADDVLIYAGISILYPMPQRVSAKAPEAFSRRRKRRWDQAIWAAQAAQMRFKCFAIGQNIQTLHLPPPMS